MAGSNDFIVPMTTRDTKGRLRAVNADSATITKGSVVYIDSVSGTGLLKFKRAAAGTNGTLYLCAYDVAAGDQGELVDWMILANQVTTGLTAGASPWYLTSAGATASAPAAVPHRVGTVLQVHATTGRVLLTPRVWGADSKLTATVTLTAAQANALNTTPVTVVADPGAGFAVLVDELVASYQHVTTGPTCQAGEDLVLVYASAATTAITDPIDDAVFTAADADITAVARGTRGVALVPSEAVKVTTLSGDWASMAGSTMEIKVTYRIVRV